MHSILSQYSASITELKKNPSALIKKAENAPIAILNHNTPAAYLIPASTYEALLNKLEDLELAKVVKERESELNKAEDVSIDEL